MLFLYYFQMCLCFLYYIYYVNIIIQVKSYCSIFYIECNLTHVLLDNSCDGLYEINKSGYSVLFLIELLFFDIPDFVLFINTISYIYIYIEMN